MKKNSTPKKISKKKPKEEEIKTEKELSNNIMPEIDEDEDSEKVFIKSNKITEALDNDFQEELPSLTGKNKVSLEKINRQRDSGFNLEEFLEDSPLNKPPIQSWQSEFDPMSYTTGIKNSDEPKYFDYGVGSLNPVERINMRSLSALNEERATFQFNPMIKQEEKSIEIYASAKQFDEREIRKKKEEFFDSGKQVKYTPSKS